MGVSSCSPVLTASFMGYFVCMGHRGGGKVHGGFHLGSNVVDFSIRAFAGIFG
jgi:hypothetical protein